MRIAWVVVWLGPLALATLTTVAACKGNDASTAPDPAAIKAQQDLLRRRDALEANRARLEGERQKVVDQIKQAEAAGGDTKALAKQRDDLTAQIDGQSAELGQMSDKITSLSSKLDSAAAIAIREDKMAQREAKVGSREATIGERHATSRREREHRGATPVRCDRARRLCWGGGRTCARTLG